MDDRLHDILRAAVARGLLPDTAAVPKQEHRPWPVVLLMALGSWLAAVPLLIVVGSLLGDLALRGAGSYVIGVLVLGAAVVVLRAKGVPLFVEQLAVPALLVGLGSLGFGLFRDAREAGALALSVVALGLAAALPRPWLRVLLGAAAAQLLAIACVPGRWTGSGHALMESFWFGWHASFAAWAAGQWVRRRALDDGPRAQWAAALESASAGWLLATLAGLAWWSGMTFLVGASLGGGVLQDIGTDLAARYRHAPVLQGVSVFLAAGGAGWMARRWPGARQPWLAGVAAVLLVLAWFLPALGAVLAALAYCASTRRWRLACAAAVAAAWIVGGFYYQLTWPLQFKALVLVGAGAVLGALAWLSLRGRSDVALAAHGEAVPPGSAWPARAGIAVSLLAVLAVANVGIWQKEDLIAHGQPVFVELAPRDPRSLMQGDFMALNFRLPVDGVDTGRQGTLSSGRPHVVARRDARGVATPLRLDDGAPLGSDELRIELTPMDGRWVLVTDAWFFKEGDAQRWSAARYGEFRVKADGQALLVGLRDANLRSL